MLTGLLIFLLVVIALLAIPLVIEFRVEWPNGEQNEIVLLWALGFVRTRLVSRAPDKTSTESSSPRESIKGDSSKSTNVLAAMRLQSFRQRTYRFVGDLWRTIKKENVHVRARIGLGDPADTGKLWAFVGPASGVIGGLKEVSAVIEPDFADKVFEVDGRGRLRIVPLQVVAVVVRVLVSPAIWRGLRAMRAA